jgi:adenylate cyclase
VGFADVVGYTRLTRSFSEAELAALIDRFESTAADVVAAASGRVVKMLGDEVLFVADEPSAAAVIGLGLLEAIDTDGALPEVRIGMARGNVLSRFGDVYGPVVNIASRLTSAAKPGTILVDDALAASLTGRPDVRLHRRRRMAVRGYSHLSSWRLSRAAPVD